MSYEEQEALKNLTLATAGYLEHRLAPAAAQRMPVEEPNAEEQASVPTPPVPAE